ncbi:MAG: response regulator [Thermoleophilia bacterium]
MTRGALILVVDDEPLILRGLGARLRAAGFEVRTAVSAAAAFDAIALDAPDAIVLDLRLPDLDGVEVCRRLREWSRVPVIVVSAMHEEAQKIAALDAGADDYVTKPYAAGELLARIRAALRRAAGAGADDPLVEFGDVHVNLALREVRREGARVHLTPLEYDLLAELARNPGRVMTHETLLQAVWGLSHCGQTHYLRVYMANLRRKLERDPSRPEHLLTQTGVGYRLDLGEPA